MLKDKHPEKSMGYAIAPLIIVIIWDSHFEKEIIAKVTYTLFNSWRGSTAFTSSPSCRSDTRHCMLFSNTYTKPPVPQPNLKRRHTLLHRIRSVFMQP